MNPGDVKDLVAAKDTELLDWVETEVIAITSHPLGWEIIWTNDLNEPEHPEPVFIEGTCLREVLAIAMARQEADIQSSLNTGQLPPIPDVTEDQMRFTCGRLLEGGGD